VVCAWGEERWFCKGELTQCASSAELQAAESREWQAHGNYVWRHMADHHGRCWIGWEELRHYELYARGVLLS
jgi:hypothetical protein